MANQITRCSFVAGVGGVLVAFTAQRGTTREGISFADDARVPLDVRPYGPTRALNGSIVRDVTFRSSVFGRVPTYVVRPRNGKAHAGIVFAHWALGDREEFLEEATRMARLGVVSVLPDSTFVRPLRWNVPQPGSDIAHPLADVRRFAQNVIDARRAISVLLAQSRVDPKRIAFVGHSFNAGIGGIVAGLDRRPCAFVLMGGSGNNNDLSPKFIHDAIFTEIAARQLATYPNQRQMRSYLAGITVTNPDSFIGKATVPIFMQFARNDAYVSRAMAEDYYAHARSPKEIAWYVGGHELNDPQAALHRVRFLTRELSLRAGSA